MEDVLERRFNEIGARVKFANLSRRDLQSDLKIVVDVDSAKQALKPKEVVLVEL